MNLVAEFVEVKQFYSTHIDDWFGKEEITDFIGYPFIVRNSDFISSVLYNSPDMDLVYRECPDLAAFR